jgi:hypothetical protein
VASAKILLKGDRIPLQISGLVSQSARVAHSPQVLQSEAELTRRCSRSRRRPPRCRSPTRT